VKVTSFILMGSYGEGGTDSMRPRTTLAGGRVTVPAHIWKVIVVLPMGDDDATRMHNSTRVIAVDTPNRDDVRTSWGTYRVSVDAIEAATVYDLLSSVAPSVQAVVERSVDTGPTQ
jgi:endonuclease G